MSSSSTELKARLDHVKTYFNKELEKGIESNVCVFQVPKSLSSVKPEAYAPQLVGLGPYHHLHPQLMDMERVKLDVVKKLHKKFTQLSFDELVSKLSRLDLYVRSCYHKFLDMDANMLSWMITVDALFLFDLLCQYGIDKKTLESSPCLHGLANHAGKKLAEDAILRDVMMLESQIPIFFLEKMLTVECARLLDIERKTTVEKFFPLMLLGFCRALSPLKDTLTYPDHVAKALKCAHLLDLLYSMVVTREDEFKIDIPADIIPIEEEPIPTAVLRTSAVQKSSFVELKNRTERAIEAAEKLDYLKPHALFMKAVMDFCTQVNSAVSSLRYEEASSQEKTLIPTASSLAKAGVHFTKTQFIENIWFEGKTHNLYLPAIKLGVNSEVVIRNLVAYEAMAISGPLLFARFVDLMDGLIDTPDDVKLLRKRGIITGHLKDDEVARLFNGMSDSIEVNGDCELDKTINKVNEFYEAAPNIKTQNMVDRYVYSAWKVLVTVATLIFFLLMALQTFCSAYRCSSIVNKTN